MAFSPSRTFSSHRDRENDVPVWTKYGQIFSAAQGQYSSFYFPWVLNRQEVPLSASFPNDYVMFYSTDHGAGGIAAATAPHPTGPWANYGQVFNDTGPGFSTETPAVWYDPLGGFFRMFYQQANATALQTQQTLQATSTTGGTSWTKLPVANGLVVSPGWFPGDGHTGYAMVHDAVGEGEKFCYHLMGGGDRPHFGMSYSTNYGASWRTDPRPLLYGYDQTYYVEQGFRVEWNSTQMYRYRGQLWWLGQISSFGSGGGAVLRHMAQAPLSEDGRRILGRPKKLFPLDGVVNYRAVFLLNSPVEYVFYLFYQVDNNLHLATAYYG